MQLSMARKFLLRLLRRYDVKANEKPSHKCNIIGLTRHTLRKLKNTGGGQSSDLCVSSLYIVYSIAASHYN
jgi:hypothetical protein